MKGNHKQQGVSLVELLVALAILAVGLVPLLSLFTHALKTAEHANKRTIATNLARDMQEEIRSRAFSEPDDPDIPTLSSATAYFPLGTSALPFGLEEADFADGDKRIEHFDDVDDYNHWCRGNQCDECPGGSSAHEGRCWEGMPLEAYDGKKFQGAGYNHYQGFTRSVEVYNIYANISTAVVAGEIRRGDEPREHTMEIGLGDEIEPFNFYDLRDETLSDLRAPDGKSRLKVIKVTVTYTGAVTPHITVEDTGLIVLPVREE